MDVDRRQLEGALVGEHLHAIDQRDDAVDLFADEPRQRCGRLRRDPASRSWAAPRTPESGFFTSCARTAASVPMARAAPWRLSASSSRPVKERSCRIRQQPARPLGQRRNVDCDQAAPKAGVSRAISRSATLAPSARACSSRENSGQSAGKEIAASGRPGGFHAQELGGSGVGVADDIVAIEGEDRQRPATAAAGRHRSPAGGASGKGRRGEALIRRPAARSAGDRRP